MQLKIKKIPVSSLLVDKKMQAHIAKIIVAGYSNVALSKIGKLGKKQQEVALFGLNKAEMVFIARERNQAVALLAISVFTAEKNPNFFLRINQDILAHEGELKKEIQRVAKRIDGWIYTHEMVSLKREKGYISLLRKHALKNAGLNLNYSKIALFGEFQGSHSLRVQIHLPNNISIFAGEYIQENNKKPIGKKSITAMQILTHMVGKIYLEIFCPKAIIHDDDTVESTVFVQKPYVANIEGSNGISVAARKIYKRQQKLNWQIFNNRVASAIGVTFVNVV